MILTVDAFGPFLASDAFSMLAVADNQLWVTGSQDLQRVFAAGDLAQAVPSFNDSALPPSLLRLACSWRHVSVSSQSHSLDNAISVSVTAPVG
ncbi:hypothetical protein AGR3A_Cc190037 [Agrobacterium tomkonis CFBP 6623]|uniref:Uncharacterized protein n=1 Tax=Agrobacterium tomkonis CFBP 6623 TaxID=1183432 RepID=A0A1S7P0C3_9HYPH|nr:hypothetical protein AGR3A_Cc190037 [Agrobacterium tomkonis CFBP 6623]